MAKMTLRQMLDAVRGYRMTAAERLDQICAFAFGNLRIDDPSASLEAIQEAAVKAALTGAQTAFADDASPDIVLGADQFECVSKAISEPSKPSARLTELVRQGTP